MADPDGAVEVRGTVAVGATVAGSDPDALVAEIERTRENLAETIDTLMEPGQPGERRTADTRAAARGGRQARGAKAAVAVGLAVTAILVLRIWGRRKK